MPIFRQKKNRSTNYDFMKHLYYLTINIIIAHIAAAANHTHGLNTATLTSSFHNYIIEENRSSGAGTVFDFVN